MASTPLFIIPEIFLHFPKKLSYGYLRFEEMGKFLWEGREKVAQFFAIHFSFEQCAVLYCAAQAWSC